MMSLRVDRRQMMIAGLGVVLAPMPVSAREPQFRGVLDRAGARKLAAFSEAHLDTLCRIEISVAADSAVLADNRLVVKTDDGRFEFWFPVAAVKARGSVFKAGGLLTPLRGEPGDGLMRYEFNMLG